MLSPSLSEAVTGLPTEARAAAFSATDRATVPPSRKTGARLVEPPTPTPPPPPPVESLWTAATCGWRPTNRDACSAADGVVGLVGVPERAGEAVGARRAGGGDHVGEGGFVLEDEPDPVVAQLRHLAGGEGAGDVDEPGGQRLRDPAGLPVVRGADGHRHLAPRRYRCRTEGPGGAGLCPLRGLDRDACSAAYGVVDPVGVPKVPEKLWEPAVLEAVTT